MNFLETVLSEVPVFAMKDHCDLFVDTLAAGILTGTAIQRERKLRRVQGEVKRVIGRRFRQKLGFFRWSHFPCSAEHSGKLFLHNW